MTETQARSPKRASLEILGSAGVLEAAIDASVAPALATAVVCHPHPLERGTMSNKVVTTLARAFTRLGADCGAIQLSRRRLVGR